jgi:CIC family chloride channel protein
VLRFALGATSYAARTRGWTICPILGFGLAEWSSFRYDPLPLVSQFGRTSNRIRNCWAGSPVRGGCAVPANSIILATELTGGFTLLLPMLAACFAAMLVPQCWMIRWSTIHCGKALDSVQANSHRRP